MKRMRQNPHSLSLLNVPLADGDYEIEVRTSHGFWEATRSRVLYTLSISGGIIAVAGIPNIQNLASKVLSSFKTKLSWSVSDEYLSPTLAFGIWRSLTTPVDVSGTPDITVLAVVGRGNYSTTVSQVGPEYVAVAAISGVEQGNESELFLDWDNVSPDSPSDQFAQT